MNPGSILSRHDALGPQNGAHLAALQFLQSIPNSLGGKLTGSLYAPTGEHLVGVVVMVVIVVMAAAAVAVFVVVLMLPVVMMAAAPVILLMMMVVAAAFMLLVMVVVPAAFMLLAMVVVPAAFMLLIMMVVVFMFQLLQLMGQSIPVLHGGNQLFTGELIPGSGDQRCLLIMLPEQRHGRVQLFLGNRVRTAQDDGGGSFDLVIVKLAEISHINLALGGVSNCHGVAQPHLVIGDLLHGCHHIAELAHTGGLDDDPVRMILGNHLLQGLAEVAHQRAANAAGVHLPNLDAGLLQETAVNADLAELVFDQDQFLPAIALGDHFANEGCFAGSQKAGIYVNCCQMNTPSIK